MKHLQIVLILLLIMFNSRGQDEPQKSEIIEKAREWAAAWNGKIDKDRMMQLHDTRLQYYWRGKPMSYEAFDYVLEKFIIPVTNYNLKMKDLVITIIDNDAAVASFIWEDLNNNDPPGAVSLTMAKSEGIWKVINIHESLVRPLPPDDFEEQFNKVSINYQKDYMNARCEGILPYLDENLIIYENGEDWPYDLVKQYCPKLPIKPLISTNRAYKILDDNTVYEYVSEMYSREAGKTFNETQSRIWKYTEGNWKIIKMDVSRYEVKHND